MRTGGHVDMEMKDFIHHFGAGFKGGTRMYGFSLLEEDETDAKKKGGEATISSFPGPTILVQVTLVSGKKNYYYYFFCLRHLLYTMFIFCEYTYVYACNYIYIYILYMYVYLYFMFMYMYMYCSIAQCACQHHLAQLSVYTSHSGATHRPIPATTPIFLLPSLWSTRDHSHTRHGSTSVQ